MSKHVVKARQCDCCGEFRVCVVAVFVSYVGETMACRACRGIAACDECGGIAACDECEEAK